MALRATEFPIQRNLDSRTIEDFIRTLTTKLVSISLVSVAQDVSKMVIVYDDTETNSRCSPNKVQTFDIQRNSSRARIDNFLRSLTVGQVFWTGSIQIASDVSRYYVVYDTRTTSPGCDCCGGSSSSGPVTISKGEISTTPATHIDGDPQYITVRTDLIGSNAVYNLPTAPIDGQLVDILNWGSSGYTVTVGRSGNNIMGAAADFVLVDMESAPFLFDSSRGWEIR